MRLGVFIRPAIPEDLCALDALISELDTAPEAAWQPSVWRTGAHIDRTFVAIRGDVPIGFAGWAQDEMLAVLMGIGVRAPHRRFGVASGLLDAVAEHLRQEGLRLLAVTVNAAWPGVCALFEDRQFRAAGAWIQAVGKPVRWIMPFDRSEVSGARDVWVRYERRLLGHRRNRADGFYA